MQILLCIHYRNCDMLEMLRVTSNYYISLNSNSRKVLKCIFKIRIFRIKRPVYFRLRGWGYAYYFT